MATQTQGGRTIAPRRNRGQAGFTLLEAVVSLALVSIVILALAGGLLTSIRSSEAARRTQEIDGALSAYAEQLKRVGVPASCLPLPSSPGFVPSRFNAAVTAIDSWDPTAGTPPGRGDWVDCSEAAVTQRLNVEITEVGGSDTATGQVVVSESTTESATTTTAVGSP